MKIYFLVLIFEIISSAAEIWEQDMTSEMKIGLSTTGYKSVDLRCDPEHFSVNVTLEDDFEGVVYTRGSFNDKKLPCFKRHNQGSVKDEKNLIVRMRIPYEKCRTVMDVAESRYSNILVVQHDPDLIMPGDAAFSLDCSFVPEFTVEANVKIKPPDFKSKITLVDADPSADKENLNRENITVISKSEKVTFIPNLKKRKDEL